MNLYGDHGNILAIKRRCEWRGIKTNIIHYEPGDNIPDDIDIIFGGGGQDSGQGKIEADLQKIAPKLKDFVERETPTLVICGIYQLFGEYFETSEGKKIEGTKIIDLKTVAGDTRIGGPSLTVFSYKIVHHIPAEFIFKIHHIVGNIKNSRHPPCILHSR